MLQAIFEYQTAVARLFDMDYANASLYDGGTALYKARARRSRLRTPAAKRVSDRARSSAAAPWAGRLSVGLSELIRISPRASPSFRAHMG